MHGIILAFHYTMLLKILIYKEDKIMKKMKESQKKDIFNSELIKITYMGGYRKVNFLKSAGIYLEAKRIYTF